jgi:hypothetical protein
MATACEIRSLTGSAKLVGVEARVVVLERGLHSNQS